MQTSLIVDYIVEEVSRQGHNVNQLNGLERISWMLSAWCSVLQPPCTAWPPDLDAIALLGSLVEPYKNPRPAGSFRRCEVCVGSNAVPTHAADVPAAVQRLLSMESSMTPLKFYKEFELIHPFVDGNGRVGKILLNWKTGSLLNPIFPPNNLFGVSIMILVEYPAGTIDAVTVCQAVRDYLEVFHLPCQVQVIENVISANTQIGDVKIWPPIE